MRRHKKSSEKIVTEKQMVIFCSHKLVQFFPLCVHSFEVCESPCKVTKRQRKNDWHRDAARIERHMLGQELWRNILEMRVPGTEAMKSVLRT